jgi:hypothetical protein
MIDGNTCINEDIALRQSNPECKALVLTSQFPAAGRLDNFLQVGYIWLYQQTPGFKVQVSGSGRTTRLA